MQTIIICCAALACTASAFTPAGSAPSAAFGARLLRQQQRFERAAALQATLDYNDPLVKAEYTAAQALEGDDLQMALMEMGVPAPPGMSDIDLQLMLMECRVRMKGGASGGGAKKMAAPGANASPFEFAMYEKPAFKELYDKYSAAGNTNAMNLFTEYLNNKENALTRYAKEYASTIEEIEGALSAPAVESPKLRFFGFPSGMGEDALRATFMPFGDLVNFEIEEGDDPMVCGGTAEFGDVDSAKAAVEKWDGVDMGLGTKLELEMYE